MTNNIRIKPIAVATTPRAGMSLGTDYFGIEGAGCAEWEPSPGDGAVVAVPVSQMREWQNRIDTLRAEVNAHGLKFEAVISNPSPFTGWDHAPTGTAKMAPITVEQHIRSSLTEQEVGALLAEIEEWGEHGSPMRMVQTKAKVTPHSDDMNVCFPYLQEEVYIPSCQIVGKGVTDCCKHLIGRLDYCHECEHEHDEPIDLSGESI
ncbi:MAG: hypothetical protein ACRCTP_17865 [Aeromonas popoffii]|uniref:hypothetical protein n=1 Tax=Aeromonas popoffii TaxID=70856 RepID=UPI003F366438